MKKIIFIICDGMGDLPIPEFENQTPLEAANTPNMDEWAMKGATGKMYVMGEGVRPNSDEAHLTLFGYDLATEYPGRGPIEAIGRGVEIKEGDVAIRANLSTVDEELRVKDRRAGRIQDGSGLISDLDGMEIDGIKFVVKSGTAHRVIIVMRGKGLSDKISNSDVHYASPRKVIEDWYDLKPNKVQPMDDSDEAKFTAEVLQKFLDRAYEILDKHPVNRQREKEGKLKGNYLLTRAPGYYKKLTSFKDKYGLNACCVAGAGLYKGLGSMLGMDLVDVEGDTGLATTNVKAKFEATREQIEKYDFVFTHVKPTDIFGENGDCVGKRDFLEKIDKALSVLRDVDAVIAITADHSTPCSLKDHSADPVPLLIYRKDKEFDDVDKFGEQECREGWLGTIYGKDFMKTLLAYSE